MAAQARVLMSLERHGGVCDYATLSRAANGHAIRRLLQAGLIVRDRRGRYALPTAQEHRRVAGRLSAVLSGPSAAAHWGWALKHVPKRPCVTVKRHRHLSAGDRAAADVSWRALPECDIVDGVTSPLRTVVDCALALPFDEALTVADSALRARDVTPDDLAAMVEEMPGRGRGRLARVVAQADARPDNAFESVLRAISLDVPGLRLRPQVEIAEPGLWVRPDLVDERLRIVAEADSFEYHGKHQALLRDCERYDELAVRGWLVLRFGWEHVMFHPDWVREILNRGTAARLELRGVRTDSHF